MSPQPSSAVPVLFLVFNRPDTTARVFEAIRAARPQRLFIAADGPRADRPDEAERCRQVREIATVVDWPCEVQTLFRQQNLGCKRAVSSAIDWFFEQVEEGIILEDDCLPDPSFFPYCSELLARYRDDPRVMAISGDNFVSAHWRPAESYYFSLFPHIWGWASWRRAWACYDVNLTDWPAQRDAGLLRRVFPSSPSSQAHWTDIFGETARGEVDTWDYQWVYAMWKHDALSCLPAVNLISNIGFGANATHTRDAEAKLANLPRESLTLPLKHPAVVATSTHADAWTSQHVFDIGQNARPLEHLRRSVGSRLRRAWQAVNARPRA
jgi:hypothetical protein